MTWRATWKPWMERGHGDCNASATVSASQWFQYSDITPLYCSTSRLTCLWAVFHRLLLFRQTLLLLGWSSKNMYMNEPESWNHFAIDSLLSILLEQSAIITSLKKKFNDAVGWPQFYRHTVSHWYQVFDITCIALWMCQWTKTSDQLFRSKLTSHACKPRAGLVLRLANFD